MSGNSCGSTSGPLAGGRRSPRVCHSVGAPSRVPRLAISSRLGSSGGVGGGSGGGGGGSGGALSDITNLAAGRTQSDLAAKPDRNGLGKPNTRQTRRPPPLSVPGDRFASSGQICCPGTALPPVEHRAYVHGQSVAGGRAVGGGVAVNADVSPSAKDVQPSTTPRASVASPFRADAENVRSVAEYVPDVCSLLFREEAACTLRQGFLDQQADINVKMRSILIDWLTEVHMKYRMKPVTMFLTVNIIDRYLAKAQVARKRLQLVGVVAMFIAAKFEEIRPPQVADFVYITDKAYTKNEITDMECVMLVALSFKIRVPTVPQFLDRLHAAAQCDVVQKEATFYITELALMDHRSVRHTPSHLAAASVFLSNELFGCDVPWSVSMARHSRATETSLSTCVSELRSLLAAAPTGQLKAIYKKYSASARQGVAKLPALAVT